MEGTSCSERKARKTRRIVSFRKSPIALHSLQFLDLKHTISAEIHQNKPHKQAAKQND
jgi:hypothetical protein